MHACITQTHTDTHTQPFRLFKNKSEETSEQLELQESNPNSKSNHKSSNSYGKWHFSSQVHSHRLTMLRFQCFQRPKLCPLLACEWAWQNSWGRRASSLCWHLAATPRDAGSPSRSPLGLHNQRQGEQTLKITCIQNGKICMFFYVFKLSCDLEVEVSSWPPKLV